MFRVGLIVWAAIWFVPGGAAAEPIFRVRASVPGLDYVNVSGTSEQLPILDQNGQGLALIDADGDGLLDLFVCNGSTHERNGADRNPGNRLYLNRGAWRFEDVTDAAGVRGGAWSVGAAVADVDADGDFDLYVTNWGENFFFRNNGDGTFADATRTAGVAGAASGYSSSAAFADLDGDGRLDLYVTNYVEFDPRRVAKTDIGGGPCLYRGVVTGPGPWRYVGQRDRLYLQTRGGVFEDATERAGLGATKGYRGFGVVATDLDGDGDADVYVGCDVMPNLYLRNAGAGRLESVGSVSGATLNRNGSHESGMGIAAVDYDDDGDIDLFVTNFAGETNTFYRNLGGGRFEDQSAAIGFDGHAVELGWSVLCADFDNDGIRDVFVANGHIYPQVAQLNDATDRYEQRPRLYLGDGEGRLREASAEKAFGALLVASLRGAVAGDLDNDGDLDVIAVRHNGPLLVLENLARRPGYLFDLRDARGGRSPINARLEVETNRGRRRYRLLPNQGFQSSQDHRVFVTVAAGEVIEGVKVIWPSGSEQRVEAPTSVITTIRENGR